MSFILCSNTLTAFLWRITNKTIRQMIKATMIKMTMGIFHNSIRKNTTFSFPFIIQKQFRFSLCNLFGIHW